MTRTRRLASAGVAGVMTLAAGLGFHRVFGLPSLIPVVAVAAVLPVLLASLLAVGRRPRSLTTSIALTWAGWLLVVSETLFRADTLAGWIPTSATLRAALGSLRDSWKALLTTILPAADRPEQLVLMHALVWISAFLGAEVAIRSRAVAAPALPAFGVFAAALLLGVDGPGSNVVIAAMLVGLFAMLVLVRSPSMISPRGLALGLAPIAGLALAATMLVPYLPYAHASQPFDPRKYVAQPPPDLRDAVNPLDEVSAWLQIPDVPLFNVRASASENWRLVTLDRFDGVTWSSSSQFVPTGSRVPAIPGRAGGGQSVDQDVTIQGLTGSWLPAADRPVSVTGGMIDVDPATGVLASTEPLRERLRYHVTSVVPRFSEAELQQATPANDPEAAASLALPGGSVNGAPVPQTAEMQRIAQQATAGSSFPFQEALRLADYLRVNEVYDVTAPAGHALRSLEYFLLTSRRGTSEQFAAAFALLARTLGLPTRLAVGFSPGQRAGDSWQVHSGDVLVWPEVDFRGLGWVPFYPTPASAQPAGGTETVPAGESSGRRTIDQRIAAVPQSPIGPSATSTGRGPQVAPRSQNAPWPRVIGGTFGGALLGYLVLAISAPTWRRWRRRRRRTAAGRVVGAWQETLDQLSDVGLRGRRTMTVHEVAGFGARALGDPAGPALRSLADAVNEVGFSDAQIEAAAGEAAWQWCDAVTQLVAASIGGRRRLGRRINPGRFLLPRPELDSGT